MTSQKDALTTDTSKFLVLGSGSSARKELLNSIGIIPQKIVIPDIDEGIKPNESPRNYVTRIAALKANDILYEKQSYLITADTIVTLGKRVLMKTSDEMTAREYLKLLSGRRNSVFTAFCVRYNDIFTLKIVKTVLKMRLLTETEINAYIASKEWDGCAGAFNIQGRAKCFFPFISGCYSNVVGLPLPSLIRVLIAMGYYKK